MEQEMLLLNNKKVISIIAAMEMSSLSQADFLTALLICVITDFPFFIVSYFM